MIELEGRGACPGTVSGRALLVRDKRDISAIKEGDIIVSKMTTPDIMSKIGQVRGIVTEIGGVVCHAAIVAREMNIPTVVACKGILRALTDSSSLHGYSSKQITLDGTTGRVSVYEG